MTLEECRSQRETLRKESAHVTAQIVGVNKRIADMQHRIRADGTHRDPDLWIQANDLRARLAQKQLEVYDQLGELKKKIRELGGEVTIEAIVLQEARLRVSSEEFRAIVAAAREKHPEEFHGWFDAQACRIGLGGVE